MNYYSWSQTASARAFSLFGIVTPDGTVHTSTRSELTHSPSRGKDFPVCQGSFQEAGFEGYFHPLPTAFLGRHFAFKDTDTLAAITCQDCIDAKILMDLEEEYYCGHCSDSHIPASSLPASLKAAYPASC